MHGLDHAIRSRRVEGVNGLSMHCLEAGEPGRPCVLLLHGFPELAYSWRKVIAPIAAAGFYVVAPDQRGYGATTGWDGGYDDDLAPFRMLNLVQDCMSLLSRLNIAEAHVVGHDFGSPEAAYAALTRPDVFRMTIWRSWAQALPGVLLDARGGREHAPLPTGRARVPAGLLSLQERRLAG